ncbi:Putative nudix hydrolase 2 [Toxocara canis]|uniref:Putative nudix hydrolase 2 n=1 Tax=Toxocara canis TaxID=6265 RepID=A0A0B2VEP7_TOXCA|nr:Putative nudix hydrolase 2 [Toxocara canis]
MFANCPFEIIGEPEFVYHGKWLKTRRVRFKKPGTQTEQVWESAHRSTTAATGGADGVDIIATLNKAGKKYFVLVKQYRIPINGFCLEFPAGLLTFDERIVYHRLLKDNIQEPEHLGQMSFANEPPTGLVDGNESIEAAGLRELKEETGYTATKVISCTKGKQGLDPGLTDDSIRFLTVEIDGDAPENANPKQKLDDGEIVEVVLVECNKLFEYVKSICKEIYVEAMVYSFAIGYNMRQ